MLNCCSFLNGVWVFLLNLQSMDTVPGVGSRLAQSIFLFFCSFTFSPFLAHIRRAVVCMIGGLMYVFLPCIMNSSNYILLSKFRLVGIIVSNSDHSMVVGRKGIDIDNPIFIV